MLTQRPASLPSAIVAWSALFGGTVPTAFASEIVIPSSAVRVDTAPVRANRDQNFDFQNFDSGSQKDPP